VKNGGAYIEREGKEKEYKPNIPQEQGFQPRSWWMKRPKKREKPNTVLSGVKKKKIIPGGAGAPATKEPPQTSTQTSNQNVKGQKFEFFTPAIVEL